MNPSEPHTGSNEEVEHDIFMLHCDIRSNEDKSGEDGVETPTYDRFGQDSRNINHNGRAKL